MTAHKDRSETRPLWRMPKTTAKADGSPRQVGVEFELQGITVDQLADLTASTLGGDVKTISDAEYKIRVPDHGDYIVEVDYALLKQLTKQQQEADSEDQSAIDALAVDALSAVSSVIVPCEVVTPPLPMEGMPQPMQSSGRM